MTGSQLEESVGRCVKKNSRYENDGLCTLSADAIDVPCKYFNTETKGIQSVRDANTTEGFRPAICYGCDYKWNQLVIL